MKIGLANWAHHKGRLKYSLSVDGGDMSIQIITPPEAVEEVGGLDNLLTRTSLIDGSGDIVDQEESVPVYNSSSGNYIANITLSNIYYGAYDLKVEYFDKQDQTNIGQCLYTDITLDERPINNLDCSLSLRRNAVAFGDLLSSVHISVLNHDQTPANGAVVIADQSSDILTTVGGDAFGTSSYGHFFIIPGEYTFRAFSNGKTATKTVTLNPLQVKNITIMLPETSPVPTGNVVFMDTFAGNVLNEAEWSDRLEQYGSFVQNDGLTFNVYSGASYTNTHMLSNSTISDGVVVAQVHLNWDGDNEIRGAQFGIVSTNTSYAGGGAPQYSAFISTRYGLRLRINLGSGENDTYGQLNAGERDSDVKITYDTSNHEIKFWRWNGFLWTQLGETKTYNILNGGAMRIGFNGQGIMTADTKAYYKNLYFTKGDYQTHYPE